MQFGIRTTPCEDESHAAVGLQSMKLNDDNDILDTSASTGLCLFKRRDDQRLSGMLSPWFGLIMFGRWVNYLAFVCHLNIYDDRARKSLVPVTGILPFKETKRLLHLTKIKPLR